MQPTKTFDLSRAVLDDYLAGSGTPSRLDVQTMQPLSDAIASESITPDARLLTFEHGGELYAFPMMVVLSYNVIQGQTSGEQSWMMTFCNACNTGMVFDPTLDGRPLHFQRRGAYDGLMLIYDEETGSYWQHITGEALHGSSAGRQIHMLTDTRQMTAAEAVARHPGARLLVHELTPVQKKISGAMETMRAHPERTEAGILASIGEEDKRRPRFELGLGVVWETHGSMFVPLVMLHTRNNLVMTTFGGRRLLIYLAPDAIAPTAIFVESQKARWVGDSIQLDGGAHIRNDVYHAADGTIQTPERPTQLLMRWFGFALTFPNSAILEPDMA